MSELNEIDGEGSAELEAITRMQDKLAAAIEGVRTESRDMALKAVEDFATKLEGERSRKPPIPEKNRGDGGDNTPHSRDAGGAFL